MAFNPVDFLKFRSAAEQFNQNHPKLLPFFTAAGPKFKTPGTIVEIKVTDPNGETLETNLRVQESDVELLNILSTMSGQV